MRIGILTYHCPPNFGAQLQAISTIGYLKRMGHEPIVLNWYAEDLEEMYSHRIPEEQVACHAEFTEEVMPLSVRCRHEAELVAEIDKLDLDAIVEGSDALFKFVPFKNRSVFRKRYFKRIEIFQPLSCELMDENPFFGHFLKKLIRPIPTSVYAVSSQNCPYHLMARSERKRMAEGLSSYRLITVRDSWTKGMIEKITGRKDVEIYPDPVFSFNQNCYLSIPTKDKVIAKYGLNENYVLLSFSDWYCKSEYVKSIADAVEENGFQAVALPMPEKLFDGGIEKKIGLPISPLDWYALIIHSKGYIGERMHPIVVCLHNAVPFFCFDEYGTHVRKSFFSKEMVYNPESSKTYLIVKDADLLDNLYLYQGGAPRPAPTNVIDSLLSFDIEKCRHFSNKKQKEYETGMSVVLQSFKFYE